MLKMRLLTILIALPLALLAIWFLPQAWFAGLTMLLVAFAAWEWSYLIPIHSIGLRIVFTLGVVLSLFLTFLMPIVYWFSAAFIVWLWAFIATLVYAKDKGSFGFGFPIIKGITAFVMLIAFWLAMNILRQTSLGPLVLVFAFILIWAVDSGAYVVGRLWGRHYLILRVSPKKTWEGFLGGLVCCVLVAIVYGLWRHLFLMQIVMLCILALITGLFAVVGDLFESFLKRQANVKDSGSIFPGHGGVLDRFDSAIAALPMFALGLLVFTL